MNKALRNEILAMSKTAHDLTETSYQENVSMLGDSGWDEKQRILLADMALHLLQTSLKEGELSVDGLKRNLFSILMISDQFIPGHDLKAFANELYSS